MIRSNSDYGFIFFACFRKKPERNRFFLQNFCKSPEKIGRKSENVHFFSYFRAEFGVK